MQRYDVQKCSLHGSDFSGFRHGDKVTLVDGALGTYRLGKPRPIYLGFLNNLPKFIKDGEDAYLKKGNLNSNDEVSIRQHNVSANAAADKASTPPLTTEEPVEVSAMYLSVANFMNLSDISKVDSLGGTWHSMKVELMDANYAGTSYFKN